MHVCVINGFNLDTAGGEKLLFERILMTSLILNGIKARTTSILCCTTSYLTMNFSNKFLHRRGHSSGSRLWLRVRVRVPRQAGGGVPHQEEHGHLRTVQEEGAAPGHPPGHQGADGPPQSGSLSPVQHQASHDPRPQHPGTPHSLFSHHTWIRVPGYCGFPHCDPGNCRKCFFHGKVIIFRTI